MDDPTIASHGAYRDDLLTHPEAARVYEADKLRARAPWIRACERRALAWARDRATDHPGRA